MKSRLLRNFCLATQPIRRFADSLRPTAGSTFSVINHAFTNNSGELVIEATLTGGSSTAANNLGVWSNGAGNPLELVALEGDSVPGVDFTGTTYKSFDALALANLGYVGLEGDIAGGGVTTADNGGIFSELGTGMLAGVSRKGSSAPDTGGAEFKILEKPSFSEALIAFTASLKIDSGAGVSGSSDRGLWISDGTTTSLAAREGTVIPPATAVPGGLSLGARFGSINPRVVASGTDSIAFSSGVVNNGSSNAAVFTGTPGSLSVVAVRNDVVDGVTLSTFTAESISSTGDVAFRANLSGEPATSNTGLFVSVGGMSPSVLAVQEGDQVPGQDMGVVFSRFEELHAEPGGALVFRAYLTGIDVDSSNDGCVCRYDAGQLSVMVREGDLANGTDEAAISRILDFDVNDAGGLVYTATLAVGFGDTTSANDQGLWLSARFGSMNRLVAREGDLFVYLPGDVRTVTGLSIDDVANAAGGTGGSRMVINDSGTAIIKVASTGNGAGAFFIGGPVLVP